ncbi:unnamed protein product, partial [Ectocarpus fasciculatus]
MHIQTPVPGVLPRGAYRSLSSPSVRSSGPNAPSSTCSSGMGFDNRPGILVWGPSTPPAGSSGMFSGMRSRLPCRKRTISTYLASPVLLDDVIMRPAALRSRSCTITDAGAAKTTRAALARSGYECSHLFHHLRTPSQPTSPDSAPTSKLLSASSSARARSIGDALAPSSLVLMSPRPAIIADVVASFWLSALANVGCAFRSASFAASSTAKAMSLSVTLFLTTAACPSVGASLSTYSRPAVHGCSPICMSNTKSVLSETVDLYRASKSRQFRAEARCSRASRPTRVRSLCALAVVPSSPPKPSVPPCVGLRAGVGMSSGTSTFKVLSLSAARPSKAACPVGTWVCWHVAMSFATGSMREHSSS